MNDRCRIATIEKGKVHVSSVVMTEEEAISDIAAECVLAKLGGWKILNYTPFSLHVQKGRLHRHIYVKRSRWDSDARV